MAYYKLLQINVHARRGLAQLGGQTGLRLSSQFAKAGILAKYNVRIISVEADAIDKGEDRVNFMETMRKLGTDIPRSAPAFSVQEAETVASARGQVGQG